jgi:cytochrome c peroxidase
MSRFMRLNTKTLLLLYILSLVGIVNAEETSRERLIKTLILENGFTYSKELYLEVDAHLSAEGKGFFESKHLSLNGEIACVTCHNAKSGSSDGIPNAAGIGGYGKGIDRLYSGAKIVPRNSLALWGVGSKGFNTLFWDGKLIFLKDKTISQFGSTAPSSDPLITAVHLPAVEIRETLEEDSFIAQHKKENAAGSEIIYNAITANLKKNEPDLMSSLAAKKNMSIADIRFLDVASAIAAFIRDEFRIKKTRLEAFVLSEEGLTKTELRGAEIFYGKGGCSSCHSGGNFTDQKFYTVPFPQLGFGKNGFGIDYGRYNATFNPIDLYKFRTPSLYNVEITSPYGHSGSVATLSQAIVAHFDPLKLVDISQYDSLQRHEFSKVMTKSDMVGKVNYLTEDEVNALTVFLKTLSFKK